MAADGDIIKSFLVSLGFDVDESSLAAFNKSIQTAALRVTALYGAINAFAGSMVYAFSKISESFEEMGYQYHIIAPAINKAIVLRNEMIKAYTAAGINIRKVIVDSINLNMSLAKTKFAMEAIYKSVGSKFFGLLQKQSDVFRKKLYDNMPYIINILTKLVTTVFKAFDAVTQLGGRLWSVLTRVYDFFQQLNQATNGWAGVIAGAAAAWKLLNLEFLATPLGMIIAGLTAILLLYDDFKVWQEGGKSFFNWGPVVPYIEAIGGALNYLKGIFLSVVDVVGNVVLAFYQLYKGDKIGALESLKSAGSALLEVFEKLDNVIRNIADGIISIGAGAVGLVKGLFGGDSGSDQSSYAGAKNPQIHAPGIATGVPNFFPGNPLGAGLAQATNITATMQTDINITGSPNADATARTTANQQQAVNRDFVRNLKGATR
jgi:hypothetical protein